MEWRAYTISEGESLGSVAPEEWTESEAQERADELFGEGKTYVSLVSYF